MAHNGANLHSCDMCEKRFPAKSNLRLHKRNMHNVGATSTNTTVTNSNGDKTQQLTATAVASDRSSGDFKCMVCAKGFTEKSNLARHMFSHTGKRQYKCEICEKSFTKANELRVHINSHLSNAVLASAIT